jgi:hypothetical protein
MLAGNFLWIYRREGSVFTPISLLTTVTEIFETGCNLSTQIDLEVSHPYLIYNGKFSWLVPFSGRVFTQAGACNVDFLMTSLAFCSKKIFLVKTLREIGVTHGKHRERS